MRKSIHKVCLAFIFLSVSAIASDNKPSLTETPDSIRESVDRAAQWQLAHMQNFESYVPALVSRTIELRGWVQGTLFLGGGSIVLEAFDQY